MEKDEYILLTKKLLKKGIMNNMNSLNADDDLITNLEIVVRSVDFLNETLKELNDNKLLFFSDKKNTIIKYTGQIIPTLDKDNFIIINNNTSHLYPSENIILYTKKNDINLISIYKERFIIALEKAHQNIREESIKIEQQQQQRPIKQRIICPTCDGAGYITGGGKQRKTKMNLIKKQRKTKKSRKAKKQTTKV